MLSAVRLDLLGLKSRVSNKIDVDLRFFAQTPVPYSSALVFRQELAGFQAILILNSGADA